MYFKKRKLVKFNVIAFTHHAIGLKSLGHFHLEAEMIPKRMQEIKDALQLTELMYLSTCNRVEFIFTSETTVDTDFFKKLIAFFSEGWDSDKIQSISKKARYWNGINAVNHLIEVASSLDSMVLGEREIITQVRNAYDLANSHKLSGDTIRIVVRQTIETAKKVYTRTAISEKSISVVSLAYQEFAKQNLSKKSKILIIGSGITNQNICKFLQKDGYTNLTIFNRTLANAEKLADLLGGKAQALKNLPTYNLGFDAIFTCTGAAKAIVNKVTYQQILKDQKRKTIVDLAIPNDVDATVIKAFPVNYISVESIKTISDKNLLARKKELLKARQIIFEAIEEFKAIFDMRQIELKMRSIPAHVKEIRKKAETEVFTKELDGLDENAKEVLEKILNYMEKKYVSVPMIMAKEMLTKTSK